MFQEFLNHHGIQEKKIAVGVSGGSDSLALILMAAEELQPLGYQLIALTVDHQLRPSSADEAAYVAKIMQEKHIEHHTLIWDDDEKPQTGLEEAARTARYNLIQQWCSDNQVSVVMMAHHLQDQAETFFIRLQRGSGLSGLCGMQAVTERKGIKILRPCLETDKMIFKNFLLSHHIKWIEDESNCCDDLLRVKFRQLLPQFYQKTGLNDRIIVETMLRLQSSRAFIEHKMAEFIKANVTCWNNAGYSCAIKYWQSADEEIKFRLITFLLPQLNHADYPPKAKKIKHLITLLTTKTFKSTTLGGCEIILYHDYLWFVPEKQNAAAYSRKAWQEYLKVNPQFSTCNIPYKLKTALLSAARHR